MAGYLTLSGDFGIFVMVISAKIRSVFALLLIPPLNID
jgi:hypothetical protein